jgi:hypothetical protein
MRTNLIITDNFYSDPDSVREFVLTQEFSVRGNFPGLRTRTLLDQGTQDAIQTILWHAGGAVTNWHAEDGLTGSFELATARDRSWIHTDHFNTWAAVCYLTPNAPVTGGTGLFRHRATGAVRASELAGEYDSQDMTQWELYDVIANRYNRLAMYRADLFHTSLDYFGSDLHTGRLFQLFFLTTEF